MQMKNSFSASALIGEGKSGSGCGWPRWGLCGKECVNKKYCQEKTAQAANITR
jgi:hypothetical protein